MNLSPGDRPPELGGATGGQALLAPTRLFARHVQALLAAGVDVRAMSHVTGGGIPGNVPRVLPDGLGLHLEGAWKRPPVFDLIQRGASVAEAEMRRTFNLGVGFVFVVAAADAARTAEVLRGLGEAPIALGRVVRVPADRAFEDRVEWPT
jgi:phosphoribosylformylglycinamidine cyclo-ligase